MKNLIEIIEIISIEKENSQKRFKNNQKIDQIKADKEDQIKRIKEKAEKDIARVKRGIEAARKNLTVPMKVHVLFSKDIDFKITASMYFYNPNEGHGDPNWRSADREEDFNEDSVITIKNATAYFVNAHYNLPADESDKKLHEKTNLVLAFDFDYIRASGTLWAYYHGDSKSVFDLKTGFEAKSFNKIEKLGNLKLDTEQIIRCSDGLLEVMTHIYGQLYLPAEKNGMHYGILDNLKKVHRSMIPETAS